MRILSLTVLSLSFAVASVAQSTKPPVKKTTTTTKPATKPAAKPAAPKPLLRNGLDSLSYAIGLNIGGNMQAQGIENMSYVALNKGIADALNNTAIIYRYRGENALALSSYHQALKIYEEIGFQLGVLSVTGNLGSYYLTEKKYKEA